MPFPQLHNQSHKSILIVEDDLQIREALKLLLNLEGYIVFTAGNGQEALAKLRILNSTHKPCLILTDLMMPIMNGDEFIKHLEADITLITIPLAMMTASDEKLSGVKIIKKPFSIDTIIRVAHEACCKAAELKKPETNTR